MAIVDWQEIHQGRSGEIEQVGAVRTYRRVFRVITSCTTDGPETLLLNAEFLGLLTTYLESSGAIDTGAILRNVSAEQPEQDNPCVWGLTYTYSSEPLDPQQRGVGAGGSSDPNAPTGQGVQDPLARPPIWRLSPQKYQVAIPSDVFGNPITNSAGAPFSPLPEIDDTRWVLTCERYEQEPQWALIQGYQDAINSDVFAGYLPGTAKISIATEQVFENNEYLWKVTYSFEIRSYRQIYGVWYSGWDLHLLDQGLYFLDSHLVPRKCIDYLGMPVSEPVPLDGAGGQLGTTNNPTGLPRPNVPQGVRFIEVTNGGSSYSNNPAAGLTVEITGGGGAGATAVAVAGVNGSPGNPEQGSPISAIYVTNPGTGYTSAPTVTISGGGGAGATATAVMGFLPVWLHYRPYNWLPFGVFNLPTDIT